MPALTAAAARRRGPPDPFQDTGIQSILNARERTHSSFDEGGFNSIEDFTLWERCITRGVPGAMMPHILGNSYEIVQAPGLVTIRYELIHDVRVIPLDGRPHLPLTMNAQEPVLEFACHEGNYAVPHILSAARAAEASASQVDSRPKQE